MSDMIAEALKECDKNMAGINTHVSENILYQNPRIITTPLPPIPEKAVLPEGRKCQFIPFTMPEVKIIIQEPKEDILLYFAYLMIFVGSIILGKLI